MMEKIAFAGAAPGPGRPAITKRGRVNGVGSQPRRVYAFAVIEKFKDGLPKDWYEILVASTLCNYHEIGRTLDIGKGTVKSRLSRARDALDKLIAGSA